MDVEDNLSICGTAQSSERGPDLTALYGTTDAVYPITAVHYLV